MVQGSEAGEVRAAMARWNTACDRFGKVARLSCSMAVKGTYGAATALTAGLYATSCREQADGTMETMNRWIWHTVWQGGLAADYRLLLWIGVVPIRADPCLGVLQAAARTLSLLIQDGHFVIEQLSWLWAAADKTNPVAALRKALQWAGVAGSLGEWRAGAAVLPLPLAVHESLRNRWLCEAQRRQDILKVAASRPKLKLAGRTVQWQRVKAQIRRVGLTADRQTALVGVFAGDAVPELTAAKWNKGEGKCNCSMLEDLHHR